MAFGEHGKTKRTNVLALKSAIEAASEKGGTSQRALEMFVGEIEKVPNRMLVAPKRTFAMHELQVFHRVFKNLRR